MTKFGFISNSQRQIEFGFMSNDIKKGDTNIIFIDIQQTKKQNLNSYPTNKYKECKIRLRI